ncbi:MAG: hypothetical protein KF862_15115 [Chitinophagaceae bacterium]|nr:hypothetical protein [Chitinophagaceae bacterium]
MNKTITYILLIGLMGMAVPALSQRLPGRLGNFGGLGRGGGGGGGDSLKFEHRDPFSDSVSIRFKYLDSVRSFTFDSSLIDYYIKIPLKSEYIYLGNNGTAVKPLIFTPLTKPGWDPGFHAYDAYAFNIENTRFYNTTRPFTELDYQIGSGSEQFINVVHTQNVKPNWNFAFQFRMINVPGFFKSQNTNHSNLRFNTNYQSPNKRYNIYLITLRNSLQSAENGGIKNDSFMTDKTGVYYDRFNIPINIASQASYSRDFFNTTLKTGNKYTNFNLLIRQQYDFGKKDSLVTDSSVIKLFYPRFRLEHTLQYNTYKFLFQDVAPDTAFYIKNYKLYGSPVPPLAPADIKDTLQFSNTWSEIINDFSVYQFPDIKNQQQFLKVGASIQNLAVLWNDSVRDRPLNIFLHGEYRNRTKNKKWDIEAYGQFYAAGFNAGDYNAYISLQRLISNKVGSLQVGFQNSNRTPSYLMRNATGFPVVTPPGGTDKENITQLFGTLQLPLLKAELGAHYYLIGNYTYFKNFYEAEQQSGVFNILQVRGSKDFRISNHWHWYLDIVLQQKAGNSPVNIPLLYTRNRLVFQGRFFKNLNIATGLDSRYYTAYTPDNYSPVTGQFFPQDSIKFSNLPDIAAFVHFRIRSFSAFVRLENLNTIDFNGFTFTNNNFAAPLYPYQGLLFKVGIFWNFVN